MYKTGNPKKPDAPMTKHEGLPVKGYQTQPQENIDLANEGKELEERVRRWLDKLSENPGTDKRMVALGVTKTQEAFMWAVRSIFQPGRIKLPEDN